VVSFEVSPLFIQTYQNKTRGHNAVAKKFEEFRLAKTTQPIQPWGANDRPMKSGGLFSNEVPGVRKAHLTHDISVVYTVSGTSPIVIRLYGIFDHDDLGVGTPPNINRQRSMSRQLASQKFGGEEMFPQTSDRETARPAVAKSSTVQTDYTPRVKPVAQTPTVNPIAVLVQQIDKAWPQRGFENLFSGAKNKNEQLTVINNEVSYLQKILNRNRLYPNQQEYAQRLQLLYNKITQR
jgi:hypothetical protein